MSNVIVFATSNKGKAEWLQRALRAAGLDQWQVEQQSLDLLEIQSPSIAEISMFKAKQAYEKLRKPVLVMDGGFYIKELNGFPGPYNAQFTKHLGIERIAKLVETFKDRSCYFENVATFMDAEGNAKQFFDNTGNLHTLSDQIWPEDHPKQWSPMWRILVPTGLGYTKPLASFDEAQLEEYMQKRVEMGMNSSALDAFVEYLKTSFKE
jgi:non-canonical purine NTP pyrophosphatase (RdgB/HAM1 family)